MWGELFLAGVALFGVLVTANVLVGGQTRARHVLRDELELVEKMPSDLKGRANFEQYLSESLQVYVDRQRHRRLTLPQLRSRRRAGTALQVGAASSIALSAVGLMLWGDDTNGWAMWEEPFIWTALLGITWHVFAATWTFRIQNQIALRNLQIERENWRASTG